MSEQSNCAIAVIGIDIGKNSVHVAASRRVSSTRRWRRSGVNDVLGSLARTTPRTGSASAAPRTRPRRDMGMAILILHGVGR